MNKPDFIVLGAPKCGTSSVHQYLRQHPDIYVPAVKEQHYYSTDLYGKRPPTREEYESLFEEAPADSIIGDVGVLYLYSEVAVRNIYQDIGAFKAVVLLRNPIEALSAFHAHMFWTNDEDVEDFATALGLEEARRAGRQLPRNLYQSPKLLHYSELFRYRRQLERVLEYVERDDLLILLQEDMKRDTHGEMQKLYAFLGARVEADIDYTPHNVSRKVRYPWLQNLLFDQKSPLRRLAKALVPSRNFKRKLTHWGRELNSKKGKRPPVPEALRKQLYRLHAEDVAFVEHLLGRQLPEWQPKTND